MSSVELRGCLGSSSRIAPQFWPPRRATIGPDLTGKVVAEQAVTENTRVGARRTASPGRCCGTTATTAGLPQSARCQVAWHSSIQTVAPFQRSGPEAGGAINDKWVYGSGLQLLAEGARLLLSGRHTHPIPCFSSFWQTRMANREKAPPRLSSSSPTIRNGRHDRWRASSNPAAIRSSGPTPASRPWSGPGPRSPI